MKKLLDFNEKEKEIIAKKCFPAGTKAEDIAYGIIFAEQLGLNPLAREVMFVERRGKVNGQWISKVEPLVGRDGFLSIAHKTGQFDGMETDTKVQKTPKLIKGEWQESDELVATTKVWRKDMSHPITISVAFSEYAQYNNKGDLTLFWRTKPKTMLSKVAESQALRRAFNISGVYAPEEIIEDMEVAETMHQEAQQEITPALQDKPQQEEAAPQVEPQAQKEESQEKSQNKENQDFIAALKAVGVEIKEENGCYVATGKTYQNKSLLKKHGFSWDSASKKWVMQSQAKAA